MKEQKTGIYCYLCRQWLNEMEFKKPKISWPVCIDCETEFKSLNKQIPLPPNEVSPNTQQTGIANRNLRESARITHNVRGAKQPHKFNILLQNYIFLMEAILEIQTNLDFLGYSGQPTGLSKVIRNHMLTTKQTVKTIKEKKGL